MTLFAYIGGVDVTSRLRLEDGLQTVTSAADGTAADSGLKVDDSDGSLTITRLQSVVINETDCTPSRLFTGYVIEAHSSRGPYITGPGRVWNLDVGDLNVLPNLQAFHTSDANRPAETGSARMAWLLATTPARYFVDDGFVLANPWNFDTADYRGDYPAAVLTDLVASSSPTHRVFFLYWTGTKVALFHNLSTVGLSTSTLAISNVLADLSSTTLAPTPGSELFVDMSEVYDEVLLRYNGGMAFASNYDGRIPSPLHRTGVFETPRIGQATTAAAHAQQFLAAHAGDVESITVPVQIPSSQINLVSAGMLISSKFAHLPGYESPVNLRVERMSVNLSAGTNKIYDATLTLSLKGIANITSGGGTGGFPQQSTCAPGSGALVQSATATGIGGLTVALTNPATEGNLLVMGVSTSGAVSSDPTGWTSLPVGDVFPFANGSKMWYRTAVAGDQTWTWSPSGGLAEGAAVIAEFAGGVSFVDSAELVSTDPYNNSVVPGPAVTPTAGSISTIVGLWGWKSDRTTAPTAATGWTLTGGVKSGAVDRVVMVHKIVSSASGSYTPTVNAFVDGNNGPVSDFHSYGAQAAAFSCTATDTPPRPGQWVGISPPEVVTMSGASGTTVFPFADASLVVLQDGFDQSTHIASYNGAAGTFTLDYTPGVGSTITVRYQGR